MLLRTTQNSLHWNSDLQRPLRTRLSAAIKSHCVIISSVKSLLLHCGPPTIFLAVITVHILALDSESASPTWKHIVNECLRGRKPRLLDDDSAAAVIGIPVTFLIVASLLHPIVFPENRMDPSASGQTVRCLHFLILHEVMTSDIEITKNLPAAWRQTA